MDWPVDEYGFETRAIHAGQPPDPTTGAVMTPVYLTSTYVQSSPGVHKGYEYSRTANPTRHAYETCVANLEGARHGFAFASGSVGSATVMHLLEQGDHVVCCDDMYGGTYRLFEQVIKKKIKGLMIQQLFNTDKKNMRYTIILFFLFMVGCFNYMLLILRST